MRREFPTCIVLKNDPTYLQGFPDLLILFGQKWAALECKRGVRAARRPNQEYYIQKLNNMSIAMFVCPDTEEAVVEKLRWYFMEGG